LKVKYATPGGVSEVGENDAEQLVLGEVVEVEPLKTTVVESSH